MEKRKVTRFKLDTGEWRSKVYIFNPDTNKYEKEDKNEEKVTVKEKKPTSQLYDTDKHESYIHYLMGIEKEQKNKITNKLFNNKVSVGWGDLQKGFAAEAHKFTAEELIDTLNNENATKNIERLSKMSRAEIEKRYKFANKYALSNRDNIENRVNNAFLKGEGLEDIKVNGKPYKGLLFDENSEQSQLLKENGTFKTYFNNYLSNMKEIINEVRNGKNIDIETISKTLNSKLRKPNFSDWKEIFFHDYYGLMGGTQNIEIDFEIIPISNNGYNLETTIYVNDWYGADEDDINKKINHKNIGECNTNSV